MSEEEKLKIEQECLLKYSKAKMIEKYINTLEENQQLKDNWIKLKEIAKSQNGFKKRADLKGGLWFEIDELLDKMQELEQGSDSNGQ